MSWWFVSGHTAGTWSTREGIGGSGLGSTDPSGVGETAGGALSRVSITRPTATIAPATTARAVVPATAAFSARRRRARRTTGRGISGSRRMSSARSRSISLTRSSISLTPWHHIAEAVQPPRHERLHRPHRTAHDVGRLGLRQVLVIAKDDGRALPL